MKSVGLSDRPDHVPLARVRDVDVWSPVGSDKSIHDAWEAIRDPDTPSLVWTPRNGGHWVVTRFAPMREVFRDSSRFSSRHIHVPKNEEMRFDWIPATLDPPSHTPYRDLLNSSLSPSRVGRSENVVRATAAELIERFRLKGRCDFQADYADQLPIRVFMRLLDLPMDDADMLKQWSRELTKPEPTMTPPEVSALFFDYVSPLYEARLGGKGDDLLTTIVNGRIGDDPISRENAVSLCSQVIQGGLDTVVNMLGYVIMTLARDVEKRHALIADPRLIPIAVDEIIRRYPIVLNGREVIHDTELDGTPLKRGEMVILPTMLAGTDDRENEDPLTIDFRRSIKRHLTFGNGAHRCPGAPLAMMEMRVTIQEWLSRIPDFHLDETIAITYQAGIVPVASTIPLVWAPEQTVDPHGPRA